MPTNRDVAHIKNLRKRYEYLKSQVKEDPTCTESDEDGSDQSEEEEEVKQPIKRPIK